MDQLKLKVIESLKTLGDDDKSVRLHMTHDLVITEYKVAKNIRKSERARNDGNRIYLQGTHDSATHHKIVHLYNKSIAYAPTGSEELAMAYGNKSALLRHIRRYADSILEADKAMKVTTSASLKVKLLCRKAECHTALGSPENRNCLEKAKFHLSKEEFSENVEKTLQDLVMRAQSVVDAEKVDLPKKHKKNLMACRMITDAEKNDVWSSVRLAYSSESDRHLVAARDLKAGEIVFVENTYMNHLHESMIFIYCYHCLEYLWTVVPCEQCAYRLYCSETCRKEAWSEFHEIECLALVRMEEGGLFKDHHDSSLLISLFIKALKESGSIEQLQIDLKSLDECEDEVTKGFPSDGKVISYKSIYLLPVRELSRDNFESSIKAAAIALIGLARYTSIFGSSYDFKDIKKLKRNDTAIFAGALISKFALAVMSRITFNVRLDPSEPDKEKRLKAPSSQSLKTLGYLCPLACVPNCRIVVVGRNKHVTYALQPIKEGTMLTSSCSSVYEHAKKDKRLGTIQQYWHRSDNCQACREDWFEQKATLAQIKEELAPNILTRSVIANDVADLMDEVKVVPYANLCPDHKLLTRSSGINERAWETFTMPSFLLLRTTSVMMRLYDRFLCSDYEFAPSCM